MAELKYQNPTIVDSQLETELVGIAADGITEIRREGVIAPRTDALLQTLIDEVRRLRQFLEDTTR